MLWSHFEVRWIAVASLNRFFDSRIAAEEYAKHLAAQPFTKWVALYIHESPHGGITRETVMKGSYAEAIQ